LLRNLTIRIIPLGNTNKAWSSELIEKPEIKNNKSKTKYSNISILNISLLNKRRKPIFQKITEKIS
jgi:hypothetical protein